MEWQRPTRLAEISIDGGDRSRPAAEVTPAARRYDDTLDLEQARDAPGVDRPGSTEGDQREAPRVLAALDRVHPCGQRHVLVDDLLNRDGGLLDRAPQSLADTGHGALGRRDIEPHPPAEEGVRIDVTGDEIGIGDGGLAAAQRVAGRPRISAGAARPDSQQAGLRQLRDAAATRADLDQLDGGDLQRHAAAALEAMNAGDPRWCRYAVARHPE